MLSYSITHSHVYDGICFHLIRKCNGTVAQAQKIIEDLNKAGKFPLASEVVIAVPSIHLVQAKAAFRPDIAVCAEVQLFLHNYCRVVYINVPAANIPVYGDVFVLSQRMLVSKPVSALIPVNFLLPCWLTSELNGH